MISRGSPGSPARNYSKGSLLTVSILAMLLCLSTGVAAGSMTDVSIVEGGSIGAESPASESRALDAITTQYFQIEYHDGYRSEAESVARYADGYFEIIFQNFGLMPSSPEDPAVTAVVGDSADLPCSSGARGCYNPGTATMFLSEGDRDLFYHELVHHYQRESGIGQPGFGRPALAVQVEGTARYLQSPDDEIAQQATFSIDPDRYWTVRDPEGGEYDDLALFSEYLLFEYGRDAFDHLYSARWTWPGGGSFGDRLEEITGEEYNAIRDDFIDQLDEQERRMTSSGTTFPGFTYEPFIITPDDEVTFDAGTPDPISELGRSWHSTAPDAFEWDLTGDGEIDATGRQVTHGSPNDSVALYVTVDGETYTAEQDLLMRSPDIGIADVDLATDEIVVGQNLSVEVTLENAGDATGHEELPLSVDGDEIAAANVTLEEDETKTVTLAGQVNRSGRFDVSIDDRSAGTITVREPAKLEVVEATVSDDQILADESVTVTVAVENTGELEGETVITGAVNDTEFANETVSVAGEDEGTIELNHTFDAPGPYSIAINGEPVGSVEVLKPATISLVEARLSNESVMTGEEVSITAIFENEGDVNGTETVDLMGDAEPIAEMTVEVPPDEASELTVTHAFEEASDVTVTVNNERVGVVDILAPANISLAHVEVSPDDLGVGEELTIDLRYGNDGDRNGTERVAIAAEGQVIEDETIEVPANDEARVTVTETFEEAGNLTLSINDETIDTVRVLEPGIADVEEVTMPDEPIAVGESIELSAIIGNDGQEAVDSKLNVTIDGIPEETVHVSLPPGETERVTVDVQFDNPGEHEVAIEDHVEVVEVGSEEDGTGADDQIPGMGSAVALLAVAIGAWFRRRS